MLFCGNNNDDDNDDDDDDEDDDNDDDDNTNRIQRRNSRSITISLRRVLCPARTLLWPRCNCVQITCRT